MLVLKIIPRAIVIIFIWDKSNEGKRFSERRLIDFTKAFRKYSINI
jgi:hypothetical protein